MRPGGETKGKWRILDGMVGERSIFMFGAPIVVAPESIKDRSSGLVSKFDYVLAHMGFVGSYELSSLIGCQDKSEPTIPLGCTSG
jgi:hypothetical protein